MVHLNHGVGDGRPRHNLLVLNGAALKGLPHVDVLQGDWKDRHFNQCCEVEAEENYLTREEQTDLIEHSM